LHNLPRSLEVRVVVSGSIANDYLMTFPGSFSEHIVPDQIERLSLSFLIDGLEIRRGGVAANICFGAGQLGLRPLLVGAVGADFFADYAPHLQAHGVDLAGVRTSEDHHTAMFLCTSDRNESQIASFYPGAMSEAADIDLRELPGDPPDLVVVCPNDPDAMQRHTREALEAGWALAADPSQQLPRLDRDGVRSLVDGAAYLLSNDYESALIESKSGWSGQEVLQRVGLRVTTHGAKGCVLEQLGEPAIKVPAVPPLPDSKLEPTGVGDAFRAGFLAAISGGLALERCAQVGALMATLALESVGPQEYRVDASAFLTRLAQNYGDDAAEVASLLPR
jgi:adenosine kinase